MRIRDLHVERYGPLPRFSHECTDAFEVFYGPNESGKTLLLDATLKLLSPEIGSAMPAVSRVDETPTGHVVLETGGEERKLGDGTCLGDVSDLAPRHLRNVFVIRDSDLRLDAEHDFYDSVTQQIGDLHTAEIEAIQERFVETGRLTSVGGRDLSAAEYRDDAADVRDAAAALAADVREYLASAEDDDVAAAEREFVAVTAELQQCEADLARQETAETLDEHATLSDRLETVRTATRRLDDDASRSTLETLRQLDRDVRAADEEIDDLTRDRASLRNERSRLEAERDEVEAERSPLAARADDVDEVERALDSFREAHESSLGASRGMRFARALALGGVGLGAVAAVLARSVAGLVLAGIGAVAAGWYWFQHRSVRAAERERDRVLQRARDAGLDVATVDEVGPAIRAFRDELKRLRAREEDLDREISIKSGLLEEREGELEAEREARRADRAEKQQLLREADVPDVETYRERVERAERLERDRESAAQSLADSLGVPEADDPDAADEIGYWEAELDEMVADVDGSGTADDYDPDRLAALRADHERLQDRRRELRERLDEHERALDEFDDRVREIPARRFLDEPVSLAARSLEGLSDLARDLDRLVDRIERDADVAREALDVFDELKATEEQKITDLFGPDSHATTVFGEITDDRYTGVSYDPDERRLQVHRDGQAVLAPRELSHGTTEQLYFAARVGLATRLLNAEPGFLLLDDAFLPADGTRLRNGFEVLRHLASEGWQILYFTAKDEVGTDLVERHDLRCRTLDRLG